MKNLKILIVDDEPAIRHILSNVIEREGCEIDVAEDGTSALQALSKKEFDVVFSDVRMPDFTGIELLKRAREKGIESQFIIMTAFASVNTAIEAMRNGAYDYLTKPLRPEDIVHRLNQISDFIGLRSENKVLRELVMGIGDSQCQMVSDAMNVVDRLILKVAKTDSTVLVTGESGTGKGITARTIHQNSHRSSGTFIPVNCGAIPEALMESELFGHAKGAFTGANKAKKGLFEEANGGTIFLDEIGELPLHLQVKLLHVLEDKRARPVGSERFVDIDARIIAATNRDLQQMVKEGKFREDLYFRLNIFNIDLPPIRERKEDIQLLVKFFIQSERKKMGLNQAYEIEQEALELIENYSYPGNIRELENTIARAMILADDNMIRTTDLPNQLLNQKNIQTGVKTLREQVQDFEQEVIKKALNVANGDRRIAAERLGLGLSSLYRKLDE
ncbi:sigma-54 dependent transcriptional regulator [Thalassotalea sp. G2M2-11]|uniref:sigma-54-dependent transcriptional regulator n=1 Tax=Thalassotalea sp. G2M2-11 TaxID=2787627 RepID=UPI0019D17B95|nr:sigma-54 dependent transcriptional regulator [Thalassotalea sp. G2M2-11]